MSVVLRAEEHPASTSIQSSLQQDLLCTTGSISEHTTSQHLHNGPKPTGEDGLFPTQASPKPKLDRWFINLDPNLTDFYCNVEHQPLPEKAAMDYCSLSKTVPTTTPIPTVTQSY